jgi:hypothetical protein
VKDSIAGDREERTIVAEGEEAGGLEDSFEEGRVGFRVLFSPVQRAEGQ